MMVTRKQAYIYVCSDAVGETAEAVTEATIRQFSDTKVQVKRFGHIQTEDEVSQLLATVQATGGFVAYTLVQPHLREKMKQEAISRDIRIVDLMGPMMEAYIDTFDRKPKPDPGQRQVLDEAYFRRIEAMEYAVRHDDGKDLNGLIEADVIIIGVSRTSKTPLSIFLAHKGIKTANVPIIPDTNPPKELFEANEQLIVGLTIDPDHLISIRKERLKTLGLPDQASYASKEQVEKETNTAIKLMDELNCPTFNVSNKSIEETAGLILNLSRNK